MITVKYILYSDINNYAEYNEWMALVCHLNLPENQLLTCKDGKRVVAYQLFLGQV